MGDRLRVCLGIDPDLHTTGVAMVVESNDPKKFWVTLNTTLRAKSKIKMLEKIREYFDCNMDKMGVDLVVVESPRIYQKVKVDPNDIVELAQIAGGAAACLSKIPVKMPKPSEWKGSVPKKIHHGRIKAKLVAPAGKNIHEVDAIGLAIWGLDSLRAAEKRSARP